jgi:hypothetical protein
VPSQHRAARFAHLFEAPKKDRFENVRIALKALAAAMAPKVNGSSTIGVKKSTVCTRARSALNRYTPASSAVSKPIRTFGLAIRGIALSTLSNNFGLSFDAQPAAFT